MWVQDKFCDIEISQRKGILTPLSLPKDAHDITKYHNLRIKAKSIDFVKGKSLYIISDEIGICDNVEYSLFFTDDFMVIDVKKGRLYVKDKEGVVFSIDSKNKIGKYNSSEDKIIWKSRDEIFEYCIHFVSVKYNLEIIKDKKDYINNLFFVLKSSYFVNDGKLFTIQPIKYLEDLGSKFNFEIKEKKEVITQSAVDYDIKEDEIFSKVSNKQYAVDDFNNDDDLDDYEEIPLSLHEIDIFKDYSSDSY